MRTRFASWVAAAAPVAALVAVLAAGCGAPDDETLLRFQGFQAAGSSGTGTISMIEGDVQDGQPLKVDASFENQTVALLDANAMGITIYRVEVDYVMASMDPPSFAFPVNLYAPPATSKDATGGGKVVLSDLPIVPASVKQWLIAHNASAGKGVIEMTAKATFRAKTDAGEELSVDGALAITLTDGGGGVPTDSEVTIQATKQDAVRSSGTDGEFTVYRSAGTDALKISYSVATTGTGQAVPGTSCTTGVDYMKLSGSISLAAFQNEKAFPVTVCSTASGLPKTVQVTLVNGTGYTVIQPSSATVTIREN